MQVIIALAVVFFLFKIPCDGPVLLFVLLCLLQGEQFGDIEDEDEDDDKDEDEDPFSWTSFSNQYSGMVGMSYGFFLSTICDTTADAMKMAISSFFPVLMVVATYFPFFPHLSQDMF